MQSGWLNLSHVPFTISWTSAPRWHTYIMLFKHLHVSVTCVCPAMVESSRTKKRCRLVTKIFVLTKPCSGNYSCNAIKVFLLRWYFDGSSADRRIWMSNRFYLRNCNCVFLWPSTCTATKKKHIHLCCQKITSVLEYLGCPNVRHAHSVRRLKYSCFPYHKACHHINVKKSTESKQKWKIAMLHLSCDSYNRVPLTDFEYHVTGHRKN